MSLHQNIRVKLHCERCLTLHETEVRFHSEVGYGAEYELGEFIRGSEGVYFGEEYEGNANRYCWPCFREWSNAQALATYGGLVELLENDVVTAKAKGQDLPLTSEEVLKCADEYVSEQKASGLIEVTIPYLDEFDLTFAGEPVEKEGDLEIWNRFLDGLEPLIARRMQADGWRDYQRTWEDFRVFVDDANRVVVEDLNGKRLLPDGSRCSMRESRFVNRKS